ARPDHTLLNGRRVSFSLSNTRARPRRRPRQFTQLSTESQRRRLHGGVAREPATARFGRQRAHRAATSQGREKNEQSELRPPDCRSTGAIGTCYRLARGKLPRRQERLSASYGVRRALETRERPPPL